jgi:uncharacterized phage protein gp47/JayE
MPLSLSDLQTPLSPDSVRAVVEQILTCLQFPVTAWQAESNARAFVELASRLAAEQSKPVAQIAKMVHLDTAEEEFLDAKLKSDYDEERQAAVAASFNVSFVNSGLVTYPVSAGQVVVRAKNGRTFSNVTTGGTLTAGLTTPLPVTAEVAGSAGNIPAQELELVTPFAGVRAFFDGVLLTAGSDQESDANARERARSKWATLRTEKISQGILNLVRTAAPALHGVSIDDNNPRGPGTLDVYLAADTATAGISDVNAVQLALNGALFGTGTSEVAGLAIAAPTVLFPLAATVYTKGVNETDTLNALVAAWRAFLLTVPVGGFDLSPGPNHIIQVEQITTYLAKAVPGVVSITITTPSADFAVGAHAKVLESTMAFTIVPVTEG